jgi:hypothetical protein
MSNGTQERRILFSSPKSLLPAVPILDALIGTTTRWNPRRGPTNRRPLAARSKAEAIRRPVGEGLEPAEGGTVKYAPGIGPTGDRRYGTATASA